MQFSKNELAYIFSTQNIRFLAFYDCCSCDRKKCDSCVPKTVISKKFEIFRF